MAATITYANTLGSKDYQALITPRQARELCGNNPMPRMGTETVVATRANSPYFRDSLYVANVSGQFFAVSYSVPRAQWPDNFGIKL